jgi:hypothetical protein
LDGVDITQYHQSVQALLAAMPSAQSTVAAANTQIGKGSLYGALREYRKLLETEPASDRWRAELLGVFQETKRPADEPRTSPIVIRAPRRGRSGTRLPSYRSSEQPRSEVA